LRSAPHALEASGFRKDRSLEGQAVRAGFAEPGGDDDHTADAGLAALADEARDLHGGGADDAEVGYLGKGCGVREAGDSHYGFDRRADRIDDAAKAASDEVREDSPADALRIGADPGEGDPLGLEDLAEREEVHRGLRDARAGSFILAHGHPVFKGRRRRRGGERRADQIRLRASIGILSGL
jgi:hypothetical protein